MRAQLAAGLQPPESGWGMPGPGDTCLAAGGTSEERGEEGALVQEADVVG